MSLATILLRTLLAIVAIALLLPLSYMAWHSVILPARIRYARLRPKCVGCGRRDESRVFFAPWLGSGGKRHGRLWRPDQNAIEFTCWECGAQWAERAFSEIYAGVAAKDWSHPRMVGREEEGDGG